MAPSADGAPLVHPHVTLAAAPEASITVTREKPGPAGVKNSALAAASAVARWTGTPLTSTVTGATAPVTFSATGSGLPSVSRQIEPRAVRRKHDAQRRLRRGAGQTSRLKVPQRRRQLGIGGEHHARGRTRQRRGRAAEPAKASNRIGAAASRPIRPGTGAPSGRPTQTPIVCLPSKPTDQASR